VIFADKGSVRMPIGSTQKMGTGTNVQKRDSWLITTGSRGEVYTNPKRQRGIRKFLVARRERPRSRFGLV